MKKTVKIIMLPTDKSSKFGFVHESNNLHWFTNGDDPNNMLDNLAVPQHLYLMSDDEIKGGDWYIDSNNQVLFQNIGEDELTHTNNEKKLIASTDPYLKPDCFCSESEAIYCGSKCQKSIPQIPESFIKAYVEANGKIDQMMVEYVTTDHHKAGGIEIIWEYPKLTDNNEVIISVDRDYRDFKIPINKEKMYSREEVEGIIKKAFSDLTERYSLSLYGSLLNNWIKKNL